MLIWSLWDMLTNQWDPYSKHTLRDLVSRERCRKTSSPLIASAALIGMAFFSHCLCMHPRHWVIWTSSKWVWLSTWHTRGNSRQLLFRLLFSLMMNTRQEAACRRRGFFWLTIWEATVQHGEEGVVEELVPWWQEERLGFLSSPWTKTQREVGAKGLHHAELI